ncbi:MAG: hypothetical protein R2705_17275 [Ilumatobacteraceae bacterium]
MRFAVDQWDPSYGVANESDTEAAESGATLDTALEVPTDSWCPIHPAPVATAPVVGFVDGVRRVDARVWIVPDGDPDGVAVPGVCASWASGAAVCGPGGAVIDPESVVVGRTLAAPVEPARSEPLVTRHATYLPVEAHGPTPQDLWWAVQQMLDGEARVTAAVRARWPQSLLVVDGPFAAGTTATPSGWSRRIR